MAIYKKAEDLEQRNPSVFDNVYKPGDEVPHSGIYHCETCGQEDAINKEDGFPPQNRHQHPQGLGPIRWRAVVITKTKKEGLLKDLFDNYAKDLQGRR